MSNYFKELADLARVVDNDIQKLTKTWEKPHLLMSGYGETVEDASPHVERFFDELKSVQDQLIEDRESRAKRIENMDEDIAKVDNFYQNMKEQCDDIENLLSEYGYKPQHMSDGLPASESEAENSILTASQMDHSQSPSSSIWNY